MPLCIAGMHRSGTSMVTRLLNLCGLNIGAARDLLRPRESNPKGFWENRSFIRINDAVLRDLGGTWDNPPPPVAAGASSGPALARLKKEALRLLRRFGGREPWGWKDPRNCLTLPFWRGLVPDLVVLLCIRHPLAVARSLHERDGISVGAALELWLTYNRRVLAAVPAGGRVVTHYGSYFEDAAAELQRVLRDVGMKVPADLRARACGSIDSSLSHHRVAEEETAEGLPDDVLECYRSLCAEAGELRARPSASGVPSGAT
jgi:hypothetical protein